MNLERKFGIVSLTFTGAGVTIFLLTMFLPVGGYWLIIWGTYALLFLVIQRLLLRCPHCRRFAVNYDKLWPSPGLKCRYCDEAY